MQILMYLRGHKLYCLQGGSKAWSVSEGQSRVIGKLAQPHANLAPCPCFSVTVDPNMLRSDVFVDFLKRVQLVSLLFFAKVIVSLRNRYLREPRMCFRRHRAWTRVTRIHLEHFGGWFLFCSFGRLDSGWKINVSLDFSLI